MNLEAFLRLWIHKSKDPSARKVSKKDRSRKSSPKIRSSKRKGYSKGKKTSHNTSNKDNCWTRGKSGHKSPDWPKNQRKRRRSIFLKLMKKLRKSFCPY